MKALSRSWRLAGAALVLSSLLRPASAQPPPTAPAGNDTAPLTAVVTVTPSRVIRPIPRTVFGTFLEPIAQSINNGFWAQILENPSFEPNPWSPPHISRMLERQPNLRSSSEAGLPLPWQQLFADQSNRYEPRVRDAVNSYQSLQIMGLPGKETGIRQEVYLPIHRIRRYTGAIYARPISGPNEIEISIRRRDHPEDVFASTSIRLSSMKWTRYPFTLEIPEGKIQRLEPADFVISLRDEARAMVDQVSLYPADQIDGFDPDMIAMLRDMKTTVIRFGGNFTSGYHWKDGIGPIDERPTELNQSWGMPEYNQLGTDEFLHLCQLAGAEPQIALNLGSGTPEEAAEWVRYVDARWGNKKGGLLWELGNELWGNGWQIGYPTEERIAARTKTFSDAVRKVDPHARLIATGGDPDWFHNWNAQLLTLPGGSFDYLATHFVDTTSETVRRDPDPAFIAESAFALPIGLERDLRRLVEQVNATPAHNGKVKVAFSEWLFSGPPNRAPDWPNMGGAVCVGGMLNMLMRNSDIVPISTMTGIGHFHGMLEQRGQVFGTPSYWAFRLFANADASRIVSTQTTVDKYNVLEGNNRAPRIPDVPYLDVVGALNRSGDTLTLFCVNRHLTRPVTAGLETGAYTGTGTVRLLHADSIYAMNSAEEPDAVRPTDGILARGNGGLSCTLPPASVAVITLKRS